MLYCMLGTGGHADTDEEQIMTTTGEQEYPLCVVQIYMIVPVNAPRVLLEEISHHFCIHESSSPFQYAMKHT